MKNILKKNVREKTLKKIHLKNQKGNVEVIIVFAIIAFSTLIAGGLFFNNVWRSAPPPNPQAVCCDTVDCHPQTEKQPTFTFTSPTSRQHPGPEQYALLKSNITLYQCGKHLYDSGKKLTYPGDPTPHPIIVSNSEELNGGGTECHGPGEDQLADYRSGSAVCFGIPDDQLILVCKSGNCAKSSNNCGVGDPAGTTYYGDTHTVYDMYMRVADFPAPGAPEVIRSCTQQPYNAITPTPPSSGPPPGNEANATLLFNPYAEHKTLQLHTFDFVQGDTIIKEPRFFCKPALYLYPEQKEDVIVKLSSQEKLTYTKPQYPQAGWHVTAYPNGNIYYQNQLYDYLYYETAVPDELIPQENFGYSIAYGNLSSFFADLLPKFGLNTKETSQFTDYWVKALPQSAYYKITIIPQNFLNSISPLSITPHPDTVLRVTVNFESIDKPINILPPLISKITRKGFTAVEWGGMFKFDKNHPFTCLQ